jgi:hypothetical protein
MNFVKFLAKLSIVLAILMLILTSDQVEGQQRYGLRRGGVREYNNYYPARLPGLRSSYVWNY